LRKARERLEKGLGMAHSKILPLRTAIFSGKAQVLNSDYVFWASFTPFWRNPHLDVCYDKPARKEQGGKSCLQILSIDVTWRPGTSKIGFSTPENLGNEWSYVKFRQFYSVWRLCQKLDFGQIFTGLPGSGSQECKFGGGGG
jgi:hypothetical protein